MKKKPILDGYKQEGKKFTSPLKAMPGGYKEVHYTDCLLPEIVWLQWTKKGVSTMFHDPRGTGWGQFTQSNNKGRMGSKKLNGACHYLCDGKRQ